MAHGQTTNPYKDKASFGGHALTEFTKDSLNPGFQHKERQGDALPPVPFTTTPRTTPTPARKPVPVPVLGPMALSIGRSPRYRVPARKRPVNARPVRPIPRDAPGRTCRHPKTGTEWRASENRSALGFTSTHRRDPQTPPRVRSRGAGSNAGRGIPFRCPRLPIGTRVRISTSGSGNASPPNGKSATCPHEHAPSIVQTARESPRPSPSSLNCLTHHRTGTSQRHEREVRQEVNG